ncbi:MAG: hypothetical protein IKK21_05665 [Clostridia bacterium]|nr:hypothetical protein [Clostridia bacterium]
MNAKKKAFVIMLVRTLAPLLLFPLVLRFAITNDAFILMPLYVIAFLVNELLASRTYKRTIKDLPRDQGDVNQLLNTPKSSMWKLTPLDVGKALLMNMIFLPLAFIVVVIVVEVILGKHMLGWDELRIAAFLCIIPTAFTLKYFASENTERITKQKRAFYEECVKENVFAIQTPRETQKAQLIAEKMGFGKQSDIAAFFEECRRLCDQHATQQQDDALADKRKEERAKHLRLTKYAEYSGRDKRINMLADEVQDAMAEYAEAQRTTEAMRNLGQQKELSWGLHGGIAHGIAGAGAGLAAAADVQARNAQIRASNEAARQATQPLVHSALMHEGDIAVKERRLKESLDAAQTKLVEDAPLQDVMNLIAFQNTHTSVSETGAITVETTASLKKPLHIFDDVSAVVDGTVVAEILDGDRRVGEAKVQLPTMGLAHHTKQNLTGMCLSGGKPGKTYTVRFKPYKLWKMEA